MGALPNNDLRASFAREQSLRGAFAAMHRSNSHLTPRAASPQDFGNHQQQQQQQQHEVANAGRRSSLKRRHRHSHRRSTTDSLPFRVAPLPFGNDGENHEEPSTAAHQPIQLRHREPSPSIMRSSKRFQPRSAITADLAQEMVHQIACKSKERRNSVTFNLSSEQHQHNGLRMDYQLGETVRCPSHMMQEASGIDSLNRHDFAFVKRSDGSFSYAILADRTMERIKPSSKNTKSASTTGVEECLVFVINQAGSTKMVRTRHWADKVRLPSSQQEDEEAFYESTENVLLCQEIVPPPTPRNNKPMLIKPTYYPEQEETKKLSLLPPTVITFSSLQIVDDDDCSLISSVSDRARASFR